LKEMVVVAVAMAHETIMMMMKVEFHCCSGPDLTKSNFFTWKEKLSIFALKKYGHLGSLFETGEYYEPPEVRIPVVPQGQVMDEFERHAILRRIGQREDLIATMRSNRINLYATVWSLLSESSKTAMMREDAFIDVEDVKDLRGLWNLILTTHVGSQSNTARSRAIPGETERELRAHLDSLKQGPAEQLSTYLRRYHIAITCYDSAEVPQPSTEDQVATFINNLDDYRFGDFKLRIKNDFRQNNVDWPATLNEAFRRASDWELDNPRKQRAREERQVKSVASFETSVVAPPRHRSSESKKFAKKEVTPASKTSSKCNFCDEVGHFWRQCPMRTKCLSEKKASTSLHVSTTVNVAASDKAEGVDVCERIFSRQTAWWTFQDLMMFFLTLRAKTMSSRILCCSQTSATHPRL
jgi:hypothetical protein